MVKPSVKFQVTEEQPASRAAGDGRARVLRVSRDLFNERGPAEVTTAQIAAAAGMNEGNLYYYFKRKAEIVEALFDVFRAELLEAAALRPGAAFDDYLRGWFDLMWRHRFIYRDAGALQRLAPNLKTKLPALLVDGFALIDAAFDTMIASGRFKIEAETRARLLVNSWIVASSWINFVEARDGRTALRREDLDEGYAQVRALFEPYFER